MSLCVCVCVCVCGQICSLTRGSIAERCGLRVGHKIIEINGTSTVGMKHADIVHLLSSTVGDVSVLELRHSGISLTQNSGDQKKFNLLKVSKCAIHTCIYKRPETSNAGRVSD